MTLGIHIQPSDKKIKNGEQLFEIGKKIYGNWIGRWWIGAYYLKALETQGEKFPYLIKAFNTIFGKGFDWYSDDAFVGKEEFNIKSEYLIEECNKFAEMISTISETDAHSISKKAKELLKDYKFEPDEKEEGILKTLAEFNSNLMEETKKGKYTFVYMM